MSPEVQGVVAGIAVLAAVAYLAVRITRSWFKRQSTGCGSQCGGCSSAEPERQVVSLDKTYRRPG